MCKFLKFICKAFICIFLSLIAFGMVWIITHPTQHFDSIEVILERKSPVDGKLIGRTRLIIPTNYLSYMPDQYSLKESVFSLYALLPNITPIDSENREESIRQGRRKLSIVGIDIQQNSLSTKFFTPLPNYVNFPEFIGWYKTDKQSDVKGMSLYYEKTINYNMPDSFQEVVYIPTGTENNLKTFVICPLHLDPNPEESYCRIHNRNFNGGIGATINVSKKHSNDWLIIRNKIENQINSFIQPDN